MGSKICETVQNSGAVKMANAKGLQAEKAGKGVVGCGGHPLRTPRVGGAGGTAAFRAGSGDATGRAIWVWRLASAAARLVLFGDGRANEPLVSDDAGAVLVVAVVGGSRGSPRRYRRCAGG